MSKIDPRPLIEGINDALAELAAIAVIDDQKKLDWMPALGNNNPADARCLATAYSRLEESLSRVTPREEDKPVEAIDWSKVKVGQKYLWSQGESWGKCRISSHTSGVFEAIKETDSSLKFYPKSAFVSPSDNTQVGFRLTTLIEDIPATSPTPSPAEGTAEWAEKMAREGKRVRLSGHTSDLDRMGVYWCGESLRWVASKNPCMEPLIGYQNRWGGQWELVPEDPATAPADTGGEEVTSKLIPQQWYLDSEEGIAVQFIDKFDWLSVPYLFLGVYPDEDDLGKVYHYEDSELQYLSHLPNFNPLTDKVIDGKHYRTVS